MFLNVLLRAKNVETVTGKKEVYTDMKNTNAEEILSFPVRCAPENFTKNRIYVSTLLDINMTYYETLNRKSNLVQ